MISHFEIVSYFSKIVKNGKIKNEVSEIIYPKGDVINLSDEKGQFAIQIGKNNYFDSPFTIIDITKFAGILKIYAPYRNVIRVNTGMQSQVQMAVSE